MPIIQTEIVTGKPMLVGDVQITPQTQVLKIRLPGYPAGLMWNRPKAVIVRASDGKENNLPVTDVTRLVIWAMLAGGLLGALAIGLMRRKK